MFRRWQRNVTRKISTTTRKKLVEALRLPYRSAALSDWIETLDEFVALTCHHASTPFAYFARSSAQQLSCACATAA